MQSILGLAFKLFRVSFAVTLGFVIFFYEYVFVKDDERVELRLITSPPGQGMSIIVVLGVVFSCLSLSVFHAIGISRVIRLVSSYIVRLAFWARLHFPGLVSLRVLETAKRTEDMMFVVAVNMICLPLALPLILFAVPVYYIVGPWVLKHLWYPLVREYVPAFYLRLNGGRYQALDPNLSTIRLLQLLPGERSEPVKCQLIEADVFNTEFEAISYAWGGHLVLRRQIFVNGKSFWVTQNIFTALRTLRQKNAQRVLWIDQICINQHDVDEKADQVANKMHHIYRNAERVIAWLGVSTPEITWAFEQTKICPGDGCDQASRLEIKEESDRDAERQRRIKAWNEIFKRKWFRRTWVVQEVALAQHVVVMCGTNEMDWERLRQMLKELTTQMTDGKAPEMWLDRTSIDHVRVLLGFLDRLCSETKPISLLDLAMEFRSFETTDARDKLIGLLTLAKDRHQYMDIHYQRRPAHVFATFTAAHIERTKSLAILALAELSGPSHLTVEDLPCSWATDWGSRFEFAPKVLWGTGVRTSIISRIAKYCACGDRPAVCRREPGISNERRARGILLQGWYVDTVKDLSVSGYTYQVSGLLPMWEEFARRHLARNAESGRNFESILLAEAYKVKDELPWSKWYRPTDRSSTTPTSDDHQIDKQASRMLEDFSDRRRFFVTAKGKLGFGPPHMRCGDHVCIFEGGAVPFLVRNWNDTIGWVSGGRLFASKFIHTQPYHLVGQVVVNGIMYASEQDIKDQMKNGMIERREILLR